MMWLTAKTSGLPKNSALPGRALDTFDGIGVRNCCTTAVSTADKIMKTFCPKIG